MMTAKRNQRLTRSQRDQNKYDMKNKYENIDFAQT